MNTTVFNVPSISCSACSEKIQEGLQSINGVADVTIDLKSQTVKVQYEGDSVNPQDIRKKISALGYEVIQ